MAIIRLPEFEAFRSHVGQFLAGISTPRTTSVDMLFPGLFAALQTNYSYVDPDARLGYCATKKLVFLGYRVQLPHRRQKKLPVKIGVFPANVTRFDSSRAAGGRLRTEMPDLQIGNLNADNGYQSPENAKALETRGINNSIAQRQTSAVRSLKGGATSASALRESLASDNSASGWNKPVPGSPKREKRYAVKRYLDVVRGCRGGHYGRERRVNCGRLFSLDEKFKENEVQKNT